MKVLIACEESQVGVKAFREHGHEAYSCDLRKSSGEYPQFHVQGDCIKLIQDTMGYWDLIIAHPPCTMLSQVSSVAFRKGLHTLLDVEKAKEFFMFFYNLPGRVCIENPVPMKICGLPPFSQTIQPYQFGDNWTKLTCLWLKNLPLLFPYCNSVPGKFRNSAPSYLAYNFGSVKRSKSFPGILNAMAIQWGGLADIK